MKRIYLLLIAALALGLSSFALAQEGDTVTVELEERGNSGASGEARLTDNGDGTTTVRIDVEGAPPGPWPAQMGEGDCGALGPTVFNLNPVRNGESATDVEAALGDILAADRYISMDFTDPTLSPAVVCGELEAASGMPETSPAAEADAEPTATPAPEPAVEATATEDADSGRADIDADATAPEEMPETSPAAEADAEPTATPAPEPAVEATATEDADSGRADIDADATAPEEMPETGAGGMAGAGPPLGGVAAVLSLAAVGTYAALRRR